MKKIIFIIFILTLTTSSALAASDSRHKIGPILSLDPSASGIAREKASDNKPELVKVIVSIGDDYLSELSDDVLVELSEKLIPLGGRIGSHAFNNVQVWIPYNEIETLAIWPKIKNISAPIVPNQMGVVSEGLPYIGATNWQRIGISGRGVNVAVIDIGFKGFSSLLGNELPNAVKAYFFGETNNFESNLHGTACAEIVHDVAPEASLALLDAGDMNVGFHRAVSWMKNNDINIASSSIGINLKYFATFMYWILHGSYFSQDYYFTQLEHFIQMFEQVESTVKNAVHEGVTWVQSAGNDGEKKWSGEFRDSDGNGFHNFSATEDYNILYTQGCEGQDVYVLLMWGDDDTSYSDYDLIILDGDYNIVTKSIINQSSSPVGAEACRFTPRPGVRYSIAINKYSGNNEKLNLFVGHDDFPRLKYATKTGTVLLARPAPVAEAITVGAVFPQDGDIVIASYSSQGPGINGVMKPDVVAPTGVTTVSYGHPFHGTSAAAPHVAGLCALLKQQYPNDTPDQLKKFLLGSAIDLGITGPDNTYGSGMAYLPISVFNQPTLYFPYISSTLGDKNYVGVINTDWPLNLFGKLKAFNSLGQELAYKQFFLSQNDRQEFSVETDFPDVAGISYLTLDYIGGKACGYMSGQSADLNRGYMIPATANVSDGDMFIPHIASDEIWDTEITLLNTGNITKDISLKFDNGAIQHISVLPKEHKKFQIRDFFNGIPQPSIHSAKILGASEFVGTEVFASGNYAGGISLEPNIDKNIYFPHIANDDYWWTGLVAYNPSVYGTNLSVIPFTDSGIALPSKQIFLSGKSQYIGTVNSLGLHPETAWFKIESSGDIHSFELFGTADGKQMAGCSTVGIKTKRGILPKIEKNGGWTGIAFVNPNQTLTNIDLFAYDDNGSIVASNTLELNQYDKIVDTTENLFSYGVENFDPSKLNHATYIVFYASNEVIGFQIGGSANGMMLESIPALSVKLRE